MSDIEFRNVSKIFEKNAVIKDLDLKIKDGSFTVLVGASGCGKTTLLRMLAGIGPATSGQILMDGKDITYVHPGKRDIAMVFQNYAIYPTMSVRDNIEFGLKNNKVPKLEREKLIDEVSKIVGLEGMLDRKPGTLSGGQRQRVAIARAIVKKPKLFLMDEPLSNLDAKLRASMRSELIALHKKLNVTFVYVTHDQTEAMSMADDIVLMDKGHIVQHDSPYNMYHNPNCLFTAQFIGSPAMNIIKNDDGSYIGFRPEKAKFTSTERREFQINGKILTKEMLGNEYLYKVSTGLGDIMIKTEEGSHFSDEKVLVCVENYDLYYFDQNGKRSVAVEANTNKKELA